MIIKSSEIAPIKMSVNPLKSVVDANYCVISNERVMQYVGIGWVKLRDATQDDYDKIPQILSPHCSQCKHYDNINGTMYCYNLQRRITSRKRPCKYYVEN